MLLTQRIRKSCPQSEIFSLGGQYYGLGQSNVNEQVFGLIKKLKKPHFTFKKYSKPTSSMFF